MISLTFLNLLYSDLLVGGSDIRRVFSCNNWPQVGELRE